jgi:hypothetical protein
MKDTAIKNPSTKVFRPKGAAHASPGQRPRDERHNTPKALKGRPNRCPNPWPASTFTSSSAPKIVNPSSPIRFAVPCTPTWPPSCKTSAALPSSSIPLKITAICYSTSPGLSLSAKSSRMVKNPPPNGSKPKGRSSPHSHGSPDMEPSRCLNPTWKPFANMLPTNANITGRKRFKRNTGHFSSGITCHSMSGMCGIDRHITVFSANRAAPRRQILSAKGATPSQPGATSREPRTSTIRRLKVRSNGSAARPGFQPSIFFHPDTQGVALGWLGDGALPRRKGDR